MATLRACVWKTSDIALKCTAHVSLQRPTITDVVTQLQDCLELEEGSIDNSKISFYTSSGGDPLSHNADTMGNQSIGVSQSTVRNVGTIGTAGAAGPTIR